MNYRTAHAHDIVVDYLWDDLRPTWEYWDALQTIINAPDFDECHERVKQAAYAAAHSGDLDAPATLHGPF